MSPGGWVMAAVMLVSVAALGLLLFSMIRSF